MKLPVLLDKLEQFHGPQLPNWPTDPWLFLIWWHAGYPASDAACARGWKALTAALELTPDAILGAKPAVLAQALKAGGMVPELRAMRLKEIAEKVVREFAGDLRTGLTGMPVERIRAALKQFPNIADPGADRILLFAGISAVAAVPSNCPHVLVRITIGHDWENYGKTYQKAQAAIESEVPAKLDARNRAYLLLKAHGQKTCKRTNPKCGECPVATSCRYLALKHAQTH